MKKAGFWLVWAALIAFGSFRMAHAAIALVGAGAPANSSSTLTPTIPSGNANDLIICSAAMFNPNYTLPTPSQATYTELAAGSTYSYHKVWGRIATGSDNFTLTGLSGYTTASCSRFSGTSQNLGAIVDVEKSTHFTSVNIRLGALTPSANNEMLFYSTRFKGPGAASTVATPTSFTELNDNYYASAGLLMSTGSWIQTTATTSAQQDLAVTPTPTTAQANTSIILAIQPPGSGGGGGSSAWSLVGYGTPVGAAAAGTLTPPLPTGHTTGDWLCWFGAERNTANTLAHPSGYTVVANHQVSGHDVSSMDCKVDGGSESAPSTTAVGTAMAQMAAYRGGPSTISGNIHAENDNGSTCTTSPASPSLTISSYNTLVVSFAYQQAAYGTYSASTVAPAGFATGAANVSVNSTTVSGQTTSFLLAYYLYPFNTSLAAGNFTDTNSSSVACRGHAAALLGNVSAPNITNVNTTNIFSATATGLVITGTGFGGSTGTVQIVDGSITSNQTVTAWADTSITFSAVLGSSRYGSRQIKVIKPDNTFATFNVNITAPTGKCYFDLGTLLQPFNVDSYGAPNRFGDAANDITDNSELEFSNMTFTGGSSCANITINSDGSYKVPVDLTTLDWLWNPGGSWNSTGVNRTGQGKVHIQPSGGYRIAGNCSGSPVPVGPPVRTAATHTICASGCDYPNTTAGIQSCMGAISNGQSCEMQSSFADGTTDVWAAQIALSGITGAEGNVKTLRVADGDSVELSQATTSGVALLSLTNVKNVNIQGNSTGYSGLIIGDQTQWAWTCAQSASSPTFTPPTNCYPNDKNTLIVGSKDIGLMNLTLRGGASTIASDLDRTSSYIYLDQSFVDLQGSNNNLATTNPSATGNLLDVDADNFISEDTIYSHGGDSTLRITGSNVVLRRIISDQTWQDVTTGDTYLGNRALQINSSDCNLATAGCSPYGPVLVEDSDFRDVSPVPNSPIANVAVSLHGLGTIFRKNYIYSTTATYMINVCASADGTTTAYREGEQTIYNNTTWGGPPIWTNSAGFPVTIDSRICGNMIIADNLFQGIQSGYFGGPDVYAVTMKMAGVPLGSFANSWKGTQVFYNVFGVDPANPSLYMQASLLGTGAATVPLTDSSTWPSNFYTNRAITLTWANGSQTPVQSRSGLVPATSSAVGIGDAAPIATATANGSATNILPLTSVRPFKDDWGFAGHTWGGFHTEYGDCIIVTPIDNGSLLTGVAVRIANGGINYVTNTLTLANNITFQIGSNVWKGTDNLDGTCGRAWGNRGAAQ